MKKIISQTKALAHRRRNLLTEAGKYFIVGGVCTVLDFALLFILTNYCKVYFLTSSVISFMAGTLLNYYLCTYWIFKVRTVSNRHLEMTYYIVITGVGLGINFLVIWLLSSYSGFHYMLAKLAAAFFTYWWNFGARKYFLHSKMIFKTEMAGSSN